MAEKKPNILTSIAGMKCPNCRKGDMFCNKSVFPLKQLLKMPERCTVCGQKMELEIGFYYGTGYVSYGLNVGLSIFNLFWFWIAFGLSWKDNSFFWYLGINILLLFIIHPWISRYSRVFYLYMFVKYQQGSTFDRQNESDFPVNTTNEDEPIESSKL